MLQPTTVTLTSFTDLMPPGDHHLKNVRLDIPDTQTAVFKAMLAGPSDSRVWARAWLGSEADGTLGETASPAMNAGDDVTLVVKLNGTGCPESAFIRIESAPLQTKHVMSIRLT
jgi:hypothetical protein